MERLNQQNATAGAVNADLQGLHTAIQQRAEEIYFRSGSIPGRDIQNWVQAEREILTEIRELPARRMAVVVKLNGIRYVGEYKATQSEGYTVGEFAAGEQVSVRFDGDKMFLKRRNGRELETTIVDKNKN